MRGGAENVLRILAEMFPEAPIYTLLYDEKKLSDWFPKNRVRVSPVPQYPSALRFNHHLYLSRFPSAVESWDFSAFDVVLSTSSAFVHGIITNGKPKHICYVHSPARYLWDRTHDVLDRAGQGVFGFIRKAYLARLFHRLRIWDSEAADRPDVLLAASKEVQRRIELYWRRESEVIYPPVDDVWFQSRAKINDQMQHPDYFLIVSTLARYKRIDLAIEICNKRSLHLKIIGEGPDRKRLERLAGPTIEFYGYRQNDELADLYTSAKAVLFPGEEDFGLVPLEAMACGTPVIAFGKGGARETILDGVTGLFFEEATAQSLGSALDRFQTSSFSPEACRTRAKEFSRTRFEEAIRRIIESVHPPLAD